MTSLLMLALAAQGAKLDFVPEGMTAKMRGYIPMRAQMSSEGTGIKKAPSDLKAPMYGSFPFGKLTFGFILDEPDGQPSKLFVDANGNGDYTDDPAPKWEAGQGNMFRGTAQVMLHGKLASLGVYRFDKNDPNRAALKTTLLYYTDFGYEGEATFGKDKLKVSMAGEVAENPRIWIDRNKNGKNDGRSETFAAGKPFNIGGTTYELNATDNGVSVQKSKESVDEIPLPPDMSVGQPVVRFDATTMDGKKIQFPTSYKGKVVMLDFWATWCGPCIAELPNVIKAYEKFHEQGFEVLGISFDQENMADKVTSFTKEKNMPWAQVYEGKYWDTTIGKKFAVEAIPFCLLVDGDSGKILANVGQLRGEALEKTLTQVFAARGKGGR